MNARYHIIWTLFLGSILFASPSRAQDIQALLTSVSTGNRVEDKGLGAPSRGVDVKLGFACSTARQIGDFVNLERYQQTKDYTAPSGERTPIVAPGSYPNPRALGEVKAYADASIVLQFQEDRLPRRGYCGDGNATYRLMLIEDGTIRDSLLGYVNYDETIYPLVRAAMAASKKPFGIIPFDLKGSTGKRCGAACDIIAHIEIVWQR